MIDLPAEVVATRLVSCDRVVAAQLVNIPRVNMPIRIYADFNAQTEDEKVSLSTVGSQADLEKIETSLVEGMTVVLYDEELEVQARLERFKDGVRWLGVPDWSTKRYK
jgi:hypothetical protein